MKDLLDSSWKDITILDIFGFGKTSKGSIDRFINEFQIGCIIDNNPELKGKIYRDVPIISFQDYFEKNDKNKIVVLAAGKARQSIIRQLTETGFVSNLDFTDLDVFSTEWYFRFKNKVCIAKIGASITNRCTFNCKGCNMLMPCYQHPVDYQLNELIKDADLLFQLIDKTNCFSIIGGEPLLYSSLNEYLIYLGDNYRKKIGDLQLITNGSVLPDDGLLDTVKKYDIEVRISDYTGTIPYKKKFDQVIGKLDVHKVKYVVFKQEQWINFGFPDENVNISDSPDELRAHMLKCHGMCFWMHEGRIYYCSNAWSAEETGLIHLNKEQDYLDMEELIHMGEDGRNKLFGFYLGDVKKGYMSHCKRCRGFAANEMIPAGVQIKRISK